MSFDHIQHKTYCNLLFVTKREQPDACQRLKVNFKATWHNFVYFLKHLKLATPTTLANRLITHLKQANQDPSCAYNKLEYDLISETFAKVHGHIQKSKVADGKKQQFDAEIQKYQDKTGGQGGKKSSTQKDPSSSSDSSSGRGDESDCEPKKEPVVDVLTPIQVTNASTDIGTVDRLANSPSPQLTHTTDSVNNTPIATQTPSAAPDSGVVDSAEDKPQVAYVTLKLPPQMPIFPAMPGVALMGSSPLAALAFSRKSTDLKQWLNADQTELLIPKNDDRLDEKTIDAILEKYPIQAVVLPDYDDRVQIDTILNCLQKMPRQIGIKTKSAGVAHEYLCNLKADEISQFYEKLNPMLQEDVLITCFKTNRPESKRALYHILKNLNAQDLQAAITSIFQHFGQSVDSIYQLVRCFHQDLDRIARFRLYSAIYTCLGKNQKQLLGELSSFLRKNHNLKLMAEIECSIFYLNFNQLDLASNRDWLVEKLGSAVTEMRETRTIVDALTVTCQAEHCPVIISALARLAEAGNTQLGFVFLLNVLGNRPDLIDLVFKAYFAVYKPMNGPLDKEGMFSQLLTGINSEDKLKAIVQAIPDDLDGASLKEILKYLKKGCSGRRCPLNQNVIGDVIKAHGSLRTRMMYLSKQGEDGRLAAVNLAFAQFKADPYKFVSVDALNAILPEKEKPRALFFDWMMGACAAEHIPAIFDVLKEDAAKRHIDRIDRFVNLCATKHAGNLRC